MLTDIFLHRYKTTKVWEMFTNVEHVLLVQMYRIFSDQVCPFQANVKFGGNQVWSSVQSRLSMELGKESLSPLRYNFMGTWEGKPHHFYGDYALNDVCKNWFLEKYDGNTPADVYMKERVSFIELAFRLREQEIMLENSKLEAAATMAELTPLPRAGSIRIPGSPGVALISQNAAMNHSWRTSVDELNTRFRQADCNLNYHNGFIQISKDAVVEHQIETPFWNLVALQKWKNVDVYMKEAVDRRDAGGRDPAFYAAQALESVIKIISADKGWTTGKEKGAHNFIDHLAARKNGFVTEWESKLLKEFFTSVRNPMGHGAGEKEMTSLSNQQTEWAIEFCMSWTKSLVRRS